MTLEAADEILMAFCPQRSLSSAEELFPGARHREDPEYGPIKRLLLGRSWSQVDVHALRGRIDDPPLFSDEGFHCYFPAYLKAALLELPDDCGEQFESLLYFVRMRAHHGHVCAQLRKLLEALKPLLWGSLDQESRNEFNQTLAKLSLEKK